MSDEPNWLEFYQDRQRTHADTYLTFAQENAQRDPAAHDQLESESSNLLKVADWLWTQGDQQGILTLASALWEQSDFFRTRGLTQRAIPILEHAREAAQQTADLPAEFVWLEALGFARWHFAGDHAQAQPMYEQALTLAQQINDPHLEARARSGLGQLQLDLGQLDTATELLTQALQGYREAHDQDGEIATLHALGRTCTLQGDLAGATRYLEEGLCLARAAQDPQDEARLLYSLGYACITAQDLENAAGHFQAAVEVARTTGDRSVEARSMTALSELRLAQGDAPGAIALLEGALAIQGTSGDLAAETFTRFSLAKVYNALGEPDKSQAQLYLAYPRLIELEHNPQAVITAVYAVWLMADNHLKRGETDQAQDALHKVLELAPPQLVELRQAAEALLASIS